MKSILNIVLIGIVLILSNHVFASGEVPESANAKASISGKVVDNKTGESLAGVAISVEGTELKAYTDLDGTFTLKSIEPGNYNLILSLISYKNSLVEHLEINPGEKEVIDIKLSEIR